MLQPQPSGTRFHHSSTRHPLVVDSLELVLKVTFSYRPTDTSEKFVEECIILHLHQMVKFTKLKDVFFLVEIAGSAHKKCFSLYFLSVCTATVL